MSIRMMVVSICLLGLSGCVTASVPAMVETTLGERSVICYVYAKRTRMMVPISCAQARLIY